VAGGLPQPRPFRAVIEERERSSGRSGRLCGSAAPAPTSGSPRSAGRPAESRVEIVEQQPLADPIGGGDQLAGRSVSTTARSSRLAWARVGARPARGAPGRSAERRTTAAELRGASPAFHAGA
jgi:hypothetical protein